ncbi:hypothetical protein PR003_g10739 [Phytophthora rubi]|uniref:Nucleosome assembly protein n=1 Tax=Phytophthora rubi TaxID=129364 RepID=A0A6A4F4W8_9STRA|nr:hypothetical protein PR002_g10357 [Phytophthora rubi]KAE9033259.1 hypothetical protein PR001_g10248 [Phytophthora rubi]KAE9339989.1 hypothetical protein PR003_g10739 [Phytophthora rubi]
MAAGAYDRRGSSIATRVDAAIERVVQQFESEDMALRLDVLRALSAQARLAFETTRVRERLAQHPVASDLLQGVTSQSPVYKALAERLTVDSCSCDYDAQRNALMTTDVRWTHAPTSAKKATKKRKKTAAKTGDKGAMITKYRFERVRQAAEAAAEEEDGQQETLIKFTVVVAFGDDDATPRELLHYELACEHPYPKSYYEDQQQLPSDDEEEDEKKEKKEESEEEQEEGEEKTFGEEIRGFRFDNEVLADVGAWMGADEEELDPVDVVGFFMALPVHEDEWLVDERVCEILFQGGMGGGGSDEEDSDQAEEEAGDESEPAEKDNED